MINHPARHYIYYLLSQRNLPVAELIKKLELLNIPLPPDKRGITTLVRRILTAAKDVVPPPGFNPRSLAMTPETGNFLTKWMIHDAWRRTPYYDQAFRILEHAPLRRFLQICLIGPLRYVDVAKWAQLHFDMTDKEINLGVVRAFSHYFWNMAAVDKDDLQVIIQRWIGNSLDYRQALVAPPTPGGVYLTLRAAGVPGDLPDAVVYGTIRDAMLIKSLTHVTTPNAKLGDTQAALLALQGSIVAGEQQSIAQGASTDLLKHLEAISTKYDTRPNASLKELPIDISGEDITHEDEK